MINVRLEIAEIEYLLELVNEAWLYKRKTLFPENKQETLSLALKKELEKARE